MTASYQVKSLTIQMSSQEVLYSSVGKENVGSTPEQACSKVVTETIRLIRDGEKAGGGGGGEREREIIYLSLHCHHQNDSCIKTGSDESHFNVSLIVRDSVTRQRPQTVTESQCKVVHLRQLTDKTERGIGGLEDIVFTNTAPLLSPINSPLPLIK